MTIDSGWVKILKKECPQAFTDYLPEVPGVVFIDGQIKLMKGEWVKTWSQFIERQFFNTIDRCFETGAHTVVLGFDNYAHVPCAKNMTQRKRSQHVPAMDFGECDDLPSVLPDSWDAAMRNRSFKVKVMAMVANNVRAKYSMETGRSVIIDFQDKVEVLGKECYLPEILSRAECEGSSSTNIKRGECDVKAFSYLGPSPLLINSTDGDFVPMSLLQIEKAAALSSAPRILLFRIKTNLAPQDAKRKRGREMEYVDVNQIYNFLKKELGIECPGKLLACMIATTGCDFTMSLPQIGPVRLWNNRHALRNVTLSNPADYLYLVYRVYVDMFITKLNVRRINQQCDIETLMKEYTELFDMIAKSQTLPMRTKTSIWKTDRVVSHSKNTLWTIEYWTHLHEFPEPLSGDYGFRRVGRLVQFT